MVSYKLPEVALPILPEVDQPYWFEAADAVVTHVHYEPVGAVSIDTNRAAHSSMRIQMLRPRELFVVKYEIRFVWETSKLPAVVEEVSGELRFSREELVLVFGLEDPVVPEVRGRWFARSGCWLKIPSAGTWEDADPNFAIILTDLLRQAVTVMVNQDALL